MAWTTPNDRTTGFLVTAAIYNAEIIDNLKYLHGDAGVAIDISAGGQALLTEAVSTNGRSASGAGATGVYIDQAGVVWASAPLTTNGVFAGSANGDTSSRFIVLADGTLKWGPGNATQDTTLARASAGILNANAKTVEAYQTTTGGAATWTPSLANGLVQRYNMNATGTLTIATPGTPPANTSATIYLIIQNASGGTITLFFSGWVVQISTITAPANGLGTIFTAIYDPAISKWVVIAETPANINAL